MLLCFKKKFLTKSNLGKLMVSSQSPSFREIKAGTGGIKSTSQLRAERIDISSAHSLSPDGPAGSGVLPPRLMVSVQSPEPTEQKERASASTVVLGPLHTSHGTGDTQPPTPTRVSKYVFKCDDVLSNPGYGYPLVGILWRDRTRKMST